MPDVVAIGERKKVRGGDESAVQAALGEIGV